MKTKRIIILFTALSLMLLNGCGRNEQPISAVSSEEPQSIVTGFYDRHQTLHGGTDVQRVNLADIHIKNVDQETVEMTLSFMVGDGAAVIDQQTAEGVPYYQTESIDGVDRLVIQLKGVSYWTYRLYKEELNNPVIHDILLQKPVDSEYSYLYVSTKDDYAYQVEEQGNQLIFTFKHIAEPASRAYYVLMYAFTEYENGLFNDDAFAPCISTDGVNGVLISRPYATEGEAQDFIQNNASYLRSVIPGKAPLIVELGNNELPSYDQDDELLELSTAPIAWQDGEERSYPTMILGGRFLNWNRSYTQYAYVIPSTLGENFSDEVLYYEQLMHSVEGQSAPVIDYQFSSVLSAEYSHDGQYLAFIDQDDMTRMLGIIHIGSGRMFIPADDGFGMDTASFVWAENDNKLYAITGDYDSKQLLCYDMTDADAVDVYALLEEQFSESDVALHGDMLYYTKRIPESSQSMIFSLNISSRTQTPVAEGNAFILSPSGDGMVIHNTQSELDNEVSALLYLNLLTMEHQRIVDGQMIMDMIMSRNGQIVYYTVDRGTGWDEPYPMALYAYDIAQMQSAHRMDIATGALYRSDVDDVVLIMCIHQLQDKAVPITYTTNIQD